MIKPNTGMVVFVDSSYCEENNHDCGGTGVVTEFNLVREENLLFIEKDSVIIFNYQDVSYVCIDGSVYGFIPVSKILAVIG